MKRSAVPVLLCLVIALPNFAQQPGSPMSLPQTPVPMPQDRADDSYAIYSQLLPNGAIEGADSKRSLWLIKDSTSAEPVNQPCLPESTGHLENTMNPHKAIQPPLDRELEFRAVLDDFDLHCHQRITLTKDSFHTTLPVRMANDSIYMRYAVYVGAAPRGDGKQDLTPQAEFEGVAGIHSFSQVYFNPDHTLAMVETDIWCGNLCGNWTWVVLEKKDGRWKMLPWVHTSVIS